MENEKNPKSGGSELSIPRRSLMELGHLLICFFIFFAVYSFIFFATSSQFSGTIGIIALSLICSIIAIWAIDFYIEQYCGNFFTPLIFPIPLMLSFGGSAKINHHAGEQNAAIMAGVATTVLALKLILNWRQKFIR